MGIMTGCRLLISLLLLGTISGQYVRASKVFSDCVHEGSTLNYECSVEDATGNGATVWTGDSFTCTDSMDQLWLPHFFYTSDDNATICGNFSTKIVNISGSLYTSRLSFFGDSTVRLNGTKINCTLSGIVLFKTITVKVRAFPPPPGQLTVTFSSPTVSWNPPSVPVEGGVGGYVFGVTGEECGCVSMNVSADTTSVTCSEWTAAGQTCIFEVRTISQDCGFVSLPVTSYVTLSVPSSPEKLAVEPTYRIGGEIENICVYFKAVDTQIIGTSISTNVSYMVSFTGPRTLHFANVSCDFNNHCLLKIYGSDLTFNERYLVAVVASNMIGSGTPTIFPNQIVTNIVEADIVQIKIDAFTSTVHCTLLGSYIETSDVVCSIVYGYQHGNCESYTDSSVITTGRPGVNLTILLSQDVNTGAEFCFTVSLKHGLTTIKIIGSFTPECDPNSLGSNPSSQQSAGSVSVNNGEIVYDGVTPGSTAHLVCNNGYTSGEVTSDRICKCNGVWSGKAQICEKIECDPAVLGSYNSSQRSVRVKNGEIVYDAVTPGSTAHLVCDEGYAPSEDTRDRTCLCDGAWNEKTQICVKLEFSNKCSTEITISTVLTFLLTLLFGLLIGAISVLGWKKHNDKPHKSDSQTYIDTVAPDLLTESNPSYSPNQHVESVIDQVQHESSVRQSPSGSCPLYEDPDSILH